MSKEKIIIDWLPAEYLEQVIQRQENNSNYEVIEQWEISPSTPVYPTRVHCTASKLRDVAIGGYVNTPLFSLEKNSNLPPIFWPKVNFAISNLREFDLLVVRIHTTTRQQIDVRLDAWRPGDPVISGDTGDSEFFYFSVSTEGLSEGDSKYIEIVSSAGHQGFGLVLFSVSFALLRPGVGLSK